MKRLWILILLVLLLTPVCAAAAAPAVPDDALPDAVTEDAETDALAAAQAAASSAPRLSDGLPGTGDITDLAAYYDANGWPEQLSFAYHSGGELRDGMVYAYWEIGLVGGDEAARQAVLSLAAPTCLITFRDCSYSHAERVAAYEALLARQDGNLLQVILIQNTQNVLVVVPQKVLQRYTRELTEEFGDLIRVTDETGIATDDSAAATPQAGGAWRFLPLALVLLLGGAVLIWRFGAPRIRAHANGSAAQCRMLTRAGVEQAVRASTETPAPALWAKIRDRL